MQTRRLAARDDFAVLTVTLDRPDTISGCRKLIRKYGIQHPVLWFGPEDSSWGSMDWEIPAVPEAFLIDPQGNILLNTWVDENFAQNAEFIMDHPALFPAYGMEWSYEKLPTGNYKLDLHVTNPFHQPLDVTLNVSKCVKEYVEEREGKIVPVIPIPAGKEWNCSSYYTLDGFSDTKQRATFTDFGDCSLNLIIPRQEQAWLLAYEAQFIIPGTEKLNNGAGIALLAYGDFDIEEAPASSEQ